MTQVLVDKIRRFLVENPKFVEILRRAIEHENHAKDTHYLYWEWSDLRTHRVELIKLIREDIVDIRFNNKKTDSLFHFYYLQKIKASLKVLGKGLTFKTMVKDDLESLKIPFPILDEQKISEILLAVNKRLEVERKGRECLIRIKQGLMSLLLIGKIRVKI